MATIQPLVTEFKIIGKVEDFISKGSNCIKYLQISVDKEDYLIKVAKELRASIAKHLTSGCWVKVTGMRKYEIHKGKVKYKAYRVELVKKKRSPKVVPGRINQSAVVKPKAKVLFCQKSTCWKKGGKAACQLLKAELEKRGVSDQVQIKTVGCLKQCKKAPNMVMMPDKVRYHNVRPKQISSLIEKHLLTPLSQK